MRWASGQVRIGGVRSLVDAARRSRQAAAGGLTAALRPLEMEVNWQNSSDPELLALRGSLEAARDELARRIPGKLQQQHDAEADRVAGLREMDARRASIQRRYRQKGSQRHASADEAAGAEEARGRLEAGERPPQLPVVVTP